MIKIAICDDAESERVKLQERLSRFQNENGIVLCVDEYKSGEDLLQHYGRQYDLLILDVEMPGLTGIETAARIREEDEQASFIFSTGFTSYAYESFAVNPLDFFWKGDNYDRFAKRMQKALSKLEARREGVLVSYQSESHFIPIGEILYIEYIDHNVLFRLLGGEVEKGRTSFSDVIAQDKQQLLVTIDRNLAVNLLWIDKFYENKVWLRSIKAPFRVSRRRRREAYETYLAHCRKSMS